MFFALSNSISLVNISGVAVVIDTLEEPPDGPPTALPAPYCKWKCGPVAPGDGLVYSSIYENLPSLDLYLFKTFINAFAFSELYGFNTRSTA